MNQVQDPITKLWRFQYPQKTRNEQGELFLEYPGANGNLEWAVLKQQTSLHRIYSCPDGTLKSKRMVEETRAKQPYNLSYSNLTDAPQNNRRRSYFAYASQKTR